MYQDFVSLSSSQYDKDPDFSNVFVSRWHSIMDVDESEWFSEELKKRYFLQLASQFKQDDILLNLDFNGAGINHDGGGFSTDISETCHWLTPFVNEPDDFTDLW